MSRSRQPSINSQTYAVSIKTDPEDSTPGEANEEDDDASTDSYQDSIEDTQESTFDPVAYLHDSIMNAMDVSLEWNQLQAQQVHMSGKLKNKEMEMKELLQLSEAQLNSYKQDFQRGLGVISQVIKDLNSTKKRLEKLTKDFQEEWPIEYEQSKDKVVNLNLQKDIEELDRAKKHATEEMNNTEDNELFIG